MTWEERVKDALLRAGKKLYPEKGIVGMQGDAEFLTTTTGWNLYIVRRHYLLLIGIPHEDVPLLLVTTTMALDERPSWVAKDYMLTESLCILMEEVS